MPAAVLAVAVVGWASLPLTMMATSLVLARGPTGTVVPALSRSVRGVLLLLLRLLLLLLWVVVVLVVAVVVVVLVVLVQRRLLLLLLLLLLGGRVPLVLG